MKVITKFILILILFTYEINSHVNPIKQLIESEKVNTNNKL
jgi:hypothetical protein